MNVFIYMEETYKATKYRCELWCFRLQKYDFLVSTAFFLSEIKSHVESTELWRLEQKCALLD